MVLPVGQIPNLVRYLFQVSELKGGSFIKKFPAFFYSTKS